MKTGEFFFVAE